DSGSGRACFSHALFNRPPLPSSSKNDGKQEKDRWMDDDPGKPWEKASSDDCREKEMIAFTYLPGKPNLLCHAFIIKNYLEKRFQPGGCPGSRDTHRSLQWADSFLLN